MKTRLLVSVAMATMLATAPAFAQQTVGDNSSGSQSGAASNANASNNAVNGGNGNNSPINNSQGPITVGPSTSESTSVSGSLSGSSSTSTGGNSNSDAHATGGTASAVTGASSSTANNAASNAGNAQNITFNNVAPNKTKLETTPQVFAPALTTTLTETCMGSTSGGISVMGFGGSLGTTWEDASCKRRLDARELAQTIGDRDAALALLCQDKNIAAAYAAIGRSCLKGAPQPPQPPAPPPPAPPVIVNVPAPALAPAAVAQMAPIPNPPEPSYRAPHRRAHGHPALKCPTGTDAACQVQEDPENGTVS